MRRYGLTLLIALAPVSANAADIKGAWFTEAGKARVVMQSCGSNVCGKIVWLKEPNDASGKPLVDGLNKDKSLRTRPIIGLQLTELKAAENGSWKGEIYNPEDGKSYSAEMNLQRDGSLLITGCMFGGFLCEDQTWTPAK